MGTDRLTKRVRGMTKRAEGVCERFASARTEGDYMAARRRAGALRPWEQLEIVDALLDAERRLNITGRD